MSYNSRLSSSIHVLLHLAEGQLPQTSESLAASLRTNPVVVRQTLAGLRDNGIVLSERGHRGGWSIARDPETLTLRDIYVALGEPALFSLRNRSDNPRCIVERAVNAALTSASIDAQALFMERLATITLGSMLEEFRALRASRNLPEVACNAV